MLVPLLLDLTPTGGSINPVVNPPGCTWSFASYPAFRTAIQQLIDGDDISGSTLSVQILDLIISMGEKRVYRDVKSSTCDTALAIQCTNNSAPLPVDLQELKSVYVSAFRPACFVPYEQLQEMLQGRNTSRSHPYYFTNEGDSLIFYPALPDGTIVNGRYYKYFCSIVTEGLSGNTFFARYPDLWLYAALVESAPYVGELSRLPEWKERYAQLVMDMRETERKRVTRGSKLQTRVA